MDKVKKQDYFKFIPTFEISMQDAQLKGNYSNNTAAP
jgi:hypothetical protein